MKVRRLLTLFIVSLVVSATPFGAFKAVHTHADGGGLALSSASGQVDTQIAVTLTDQGACNDVDHGCFFDVRWGNPSSGVTLCSVDAPANQSFTCNVIIPAAPLATYSVYLVDSGCSSNCAPYDSGTFTITDFPGCENDGDSTAPPYDPGTAFAPDPSADANALGDGETEAQAQSDTAANVMGAGANSTSGTPACRGAFYHPVSNVYFRMLSGYLNWDFYLTNTARAYLGSPVTVTMPFAYVNGRPINPPYGPHPRVNTYDFHASFRTYNYIGGGGGTLKSGDTVTLFWFIVGQDGHEAFRTITCRIP